MTRIHVLGGTGYAGGNIVGEAARRGHRVVSLSRHRPKRPVAGVAYRTGDVRDQAVARAVVEGADVVISALSPRGELEPEGLLRRVLVGVGDLAAGSGVRLGVVGGAGSLLVSPGGPRLVDTDAFPQAARPEALEMSGVLDDLRARDDSLDWFLVCPAATFGAFAPGEALGRYRVGGDVLLADESGESRISGADFARAVVDEVERPAHRRARFTVAY